MLVLVSLMYRGARQLCSGDWMHHLETRTVTFLGRKDATSMLLDAAAIADWMVGVALSGEL